VKVFDAYAEYYQLLYSDKDYPGEACYVADLISAHAPSAQRLLELGCGPGLHARHLAEKGFTVHGIDASAAMLDAAARTKVSATEEIRSRLTFTEGDARDFGADRRFDAVIAIFHVASYQTETAHLKALFRTAARHIDAGGAFVFDFWYGPAVLAIRPEVRVKRMENDQTSVIRIAEPLLVAECNRVDVRYQVLVRDKATGQTTEIEETHRLRYLFRPEIEDWLDASGCDLMRMEEWLTASPPGLDTWSVCAVGRKRD
jgi:predicted TPR repeat methyltransferase